MTSSHPQRGDVALRKESVDRNYGDDLTFADGAVSLSARRAWIEISLMQCQAKKYSVALRKESVDRNYSYLFGGAQKWMVALRKESVDRNICQHALFFACIWSLSARRAWIEIRPRMFCRCRVRRRSPQGERG